MKINIKKLSTELYYHPPWPEDKPTFIKLLNQSDFTDNDIALFARLYIKYSHIHCFHISELRNYFQYMLIKMDINSEEQLFCKSQNIYRKIERQL